MKWTQRKISSEEVLTVIRKFGAPTTSEIKFTLHTDSSSIRVTLGNLMAANKIFPMAYKGGIVWMLVDGRKGRPSPARVRRDRGYGTPRQEGTRKKAKKESVVTLSSDTDHQTPYTVEEFTRKLAAIEEQPWSEQKKERYRDALAERSPYRQ